MPTAEHAIYQLTSASRVLSGAKDAIYRKRCITLGDEAALSGIAGWGLNQDDGHDGYRANQNARPDIRVTNFKEARNNSILNVIDTIVKKTCYKLPAVKISGVKEVEQIVNAAWLDDRLARCNAVQHGKKVIADYLMGGMGCMYITKRRGYQGVRWADTLDMLWDTTANMVCDVEWMSIVACRRMSHWMSVYPDNSALINFTANQRPKTIGDMASEDQDRLVELTFYYHLDGDFKILITPSEDAYGDPGDTLVYDGKNPHTDDDGEFVLPFESMFFMSMPSARDAMSMTEKMLPAQMAIWNATDYLLQTFKKGKPFYEVAEESMSEEQFKLWLEAYTAGVVRVSTLGGITQHSGLPVDPAAIQELERNVAELRDQGGTSQADRGQKIPGKITATEARTIAQMGELTAASISADNANLWASVCSKMLSSGKKEKKPFKCLVQGHSVEFGEGKEGGKLSELLRPDAKITVAEDSMVYRSKEQRIADAEAEYALACQPVALQLTPNWRALAQRRVLEAMGRDDIDECMAPPAQPQAMPGMAPPGGAGTAGAGVGS